MNVNIRTHALRLVRFPWRRPTRCPVSRPRSRPAIEFLEDRRLPSTLTVLNLNDHGAGSLREELAQAHSGDTIVFTPGLQGTINLTSGELQIGKSITITGPGAGRLAISGDQASRDFEVLPGAEVSISGLTITGGVGSVEPPSETYLGSPFLVGGGIFVQRGASLRLVDATVTGNAAGPNGSFGYGGGIDSQGTLSLTGDTIANNTDNSPPGEHRGGGGICSGDFADEGSLTVTGSTIANNYGGGIFNLGTMTMEGGMVANNVAGGGIFEDGGSVSLTGVTVTGNIGNSKTGDGLDAFGEGGGINNTFGALTVNECVFSGNVANIASAKYVTGYGGAIYSKFGPATITDSVFTKNITNTGSGLGVGSSVRVSGGAILDWDGGSGMTIEGCIFRNNIANAGPANGSGGSIYGFGGAIESQSNLAISGATFVGNVANSACASGAIYADGGAIQASAGSLNLVGAILANNAANTGSTPGLIDASGGAIDYENFPGLTLTDCTILGNIVNTGGGAAALYASGGGVSILDGTILDSVVAANIVNCGSGFGAFYLSGGGIDVGYCVTVQGTIVLGNNVNTDVQTGRAAPDSYAVGGGIAVEDGLEHYGAVAMLTLDGSVVVSNLSGHSPSEITVMTGGKLDPASANNLIGAGGSGGLINGVNGNVVL